jgi:hypothetical protein
MITQNNITSENQQIVAKLHDQISLQCTRNSLKPILSETQRIIAFPVIIR